VRNVNRHGGPVHQSPRWRSLRAWAFGGLVFLGVVASTADVAWGQSAWRRQSVAQSLSRAPRFECVPQRVRDGDKLTIRVSIPHGRDLAVRAPDGKQYFLVFWHASPSDPEPIVNWEDFANRSELTINTRDLVAPVLDSTGWHVPTRVFTKRGAYQVILGANLETEYESSAVNTCRVFFEGTATR